MTALWTAATAAELRLTAGKVENLRLAVRAFDGLEFSPGAVFSFWRALGRPTRGRGFVEGRELREGCIVPSIAGGLCQISNALYDAALKAGFSIVERHAHSRVVPGSLAEVGRDATVFWNYVDLRFSSPLGFRIEAELTAGDLVVNLKAPRGTPSHATAPMARGKMLAVEAASCETCGINSCFRHQDLHADDGNDTLSLTAVLVDGVWPEFALWLGKNAENIAERRHLFVPLDGMRRGKARYAWPTGGFKVVHEALFLTLRRALESRRLATQGAQRQIALLKFDSELAASFARRLDPCVTHLIIAQSLLVPLFKRGVLGGRTYDVLMTRPPLSKLHAALDRGAAAHPSSKTLADFRAHAADVSAESKALARAKKIVTPHASIAAMYPDRAERLDWLLPRQGAANRAEQHTVLFPGPTAGRKGAYELRAAAKTLGFKVLLLGAELEGKGFWDGVEHELVDREAGLSRCAVVVMPAYVENAPRVALAAVARGVPVIASEAVGLGTMSGVTTLNGVSADALCKALQLCLGG